MTYYTQLKREWVKIRKISGNGENRYWKHYHVCWIPLFALLDLLYPLFHPFPFPEILICIVGWPNLPIFLELRGFTGHKNFSAKTGTVLDKQRCLFPIPIGTVPMSSLALSHPVGKKREWDILPLNKWQTDRKCLNCNKCIK